MKQYLIKESTCLIEESARNTASYVADQIKLLLSVETFTIMQLLGFNYKRAIGEPLTLLLQKTIKSKIPADSTINSQ